MPRLASRPVAVAAGLALGLAACGGAPALPVSCTAGADAYDHALAAAPGHVRLSDGTAISTCVARAREIDQLVEVGGQLTSEADRLAVRAVADPTAAVALGYLVGATRRGAAQTNGVASQLRQRIESAAALRDAGPPALAALHRGIVAGQSGG